jgi:hypothetical protein
MSVYSWSIVDVVLGFFPSVVLPLPFWYIFMVYDVCYFTVRHIYICLYLI